MKICVLDFEKECDNCGECEMCDLDPTKKCDNCCRCLEQDGVSDKYREVRLADYSRAAAQEDMFNELLFSDAVKYPKISGFTRIEAHGVRRF